MASLRQTRRFSTATASTVSHHRDTYYEIPPRVSNDPSASIMLDPHERESFEKEGDFRGVRKARSHHSIKFVHFDVDRGNADRGSADTGAVSSSMAYRPLATGNRDRPEVVEGVKKQGKGKRSQSARPRDRNGREEEESMTSSCAHRYQSSCVQDSINRVQNTRGRSRSRSPSVDEDFEGHIEDPYSSKLRPHFGGPEQAQFKPQGIARDVFEDVPLQTRQRSRLRAPRSRAAASAPLSALTLQAPAPRTSSPSARKQSVSPLLFYSQEPTSKSLEAISDPPLRNRRSRIPKANSSHQSSPTPQPTTLRTLKDVTRCLGQNRGIHTSSSDSEPHYDDLPHVSDTSCAPAASFMTHNLQLEADPSVVIDATQHQHLHMDIQQRAPHRPKYGLALTSESGHVLGERSVSITRPHSSPKRSNTTVRSTTRAFSAQSRTALNSSSESLSTSNPIHTHGNLRRPGDMAVPTKTVRVSTVHRLGGEQNATHTEYTPPSTTSQKNQSIEGSSRHQLYGQNGQDHRHQVSPRLQTSTPASTRESPPPPSSLPKQLETSAAVSKTPPISSRSGIPALLRSKLSHPEFPTSHRSSGSDSSVHSLPRLRKLVICNPDVPERPSPSPSRNREKPISFPAASQDFSILALSASQTSVDNSIGNGDYIVPDEVAVAVANHEERRRRALAGLVDGLCLEQRDQATTVPSQNLNMPRPSKPALRTQQNQYFGQDPPDHEDDDDTFFSRLSMHINDDEDSLLEEPEPHAEAGFENDEDFGFDDEVSEPQDDDDTEDEDEDVNELPLPPTPKFVHPLTDGDDLESRITRVASLHRISTTPLPAQHSEQESPGRVGETPGSWGGWPPSPIRWIKNSPLQHVDGVAQKNSEALDKQRHEDCNDLSTAAIKSDNTFSSNQSLNSNILTDTELSSVGDGRLSEPGTSVEETLSSGAEALFRQLQVEADKQQDAHAGVGLSDLRSDWRDQSQSYADMNPNTTSRIAEPNPLRTWRSTLPYGAFDSLAERHGPSEMRRQEVIWELCETELAFVKSLRLILRLFINPLRHEDKTWIAGIPRDVTRLFDWFDDIMHLHSQISSALHATRSAQYPVVIQVAETLRPFVPQLELHQPYLVRLESVTSAVETMSKDMLSDFGEFVRIQTASPECESMNLSSFLLKPVQRLMKYPLFFKQLWELTPRNHPDHLATFSLLHSTDIIIRVMQEVKAREEEYELVKNLASRIKGLPSGFQLARRERRLVAQGLLRRFYLTDKECHALESSLDISASGNSRNTLRRMTSVSSEASSFAGDWTYHPMTQANNLASSETEHSLRADSISSDMTQNSRPSISRTSSRSRSSSMRGSPSLRHKLKESSVYAFVFTDLLILTTPMSERLHILRGSKNATEAKETWKLVDDVGVSRVLGVTEQSGQLASYDHLITVEMMSMASKTLSNGTLSNGTPAISVYLGIPDQKSSADGALQALSEAKAKWLDAFERCFRFTLHSLSFPSYTMNLFTNGGNPDSDSDTKNSVMSILASGLPLPMSPSQQLDEAQKGRPTDLVQEEREERGWWSLRFQQVLKEMQRSSRPPILDAGPGRTPNRHSQTEKRSVTRPLLLSTAPSRKSSILSSLGRRKNK